MILHAICWRFMKIEDLFHFLAVCSALSEITKTFFNNEYLTRDILKMENIWPFYQIIADLPTFNLPIQVSTKC